MKGCPTKPPNSNILPAPDYEIPDNYTIVIENNNAVTVVGPSGAKYIPTGRYDSNGYQIYQSNSSQRGYYVTLENGRNPVSTQVFNNASGTDAIDIPIITQN